MRVFADYHHQALFESLKLLFRQRLKWEIWRPIGYDWHTEGFWKVSEHPNVVEQFLSTKQLGTPCKDVHGNFIPECEKKNLNITDLKDGIYTVWDTHFESIDCCLTLDRFKQEKFDIIIASIPQHIEPFRKLIELYQPQAKLIFQMGNTWHEDYGVDNVMASIKEFDSPAKNIVYYHQEFDTEGTFYPEVPWYHQTMNSYIHYMQNPELFQSILNPGWTGTRYGGGMDARINSAEIMGHTIRNSSFTWHYKPEGDGFGHVLYNSYACARPAVVDMSVYQNRRAGELFVDGVTCINIADKSEMGIKKELAFYSQPTEHKKMCNAALKIFEKKVSWQEEEEKIRKFLERLI